MKFNRSDVTTSLVSNLARSAPGTKPTQAPTTAPASSSAATVVAARPVDESHVLAKPLRRDRAPLHGRGQSARAAVDGHSVEDHDVARLHRPADDFEAVAVDPVEVGNGHGVGRLRRLCPAQSFLLEVRFRQGAIPPV